MTQPSKVSTDISLKKYQRRIGKYEIAFQNAVFPLTPKVLFYALAVTGVLNALGYSPIDKPVAWIDNGISGIFGSSLVVSVLSFLLISLPLTVLFVFSLRFAFTLTLYYRGWLFEEVGKTPSWPTKLFMMLITVVNKNANYFSYNRLLPWLPLPSVKDTIEKYLETVQPLLNKEEYALIEAQSAEFQKTIAGQLQTKLWMKWLTSSNYVSDWWKELVYMRYRDSLINTNVGCADIIFKPVTGIQAARAATVTLLRQQFCREYYNKQTMKPISLGGIPLCASQYTDYHRTLRVPKATSDIMVHLDDARHIAVYHKGCWYKVNIFHGRRMIRTAELERSLQTIIDHPQTPQAGEQFLSALTAGPRDLWARIRDEKFTTGINKQSLKMIEDALEILYLDDEERFWDENDTSKYDREYERALTGDGYLLWCDKPSVYIVSKNGRFSSNAEHSVVDAMVFVHVREYIKYHEGFSGLYGPDGHCTGDVEVVPQPERTKWDMDNETLAAIDEAYTVSKGVADDFENASCVFLDYGKDFMKKARVSPDAYIQMALQMAYFKDQQKFELTYEPAVMRLFREGRTETVRSCSNESSAFVRAMLDKEQTNEKRLSLLKAACDRHQDYYRNAMAGRGVDRHLFAMYVISRYYEIKSPFLDNVFSMTYALSTSQTPQHQMVEYAKVLNKERDLFWPAGGFTCPDGSKYGVCYTIATTGDILSFHVATKKQFNETNAKRFRERITESLREMRQMVEEATAKKT